MYQQLFCILFDADEVKQHLTTFMRCNEREDKTTINKDYFIAVYFM
jgi:hypothetical protein